MPGDNNENENELEFEKFENELDKAASEPEGTDYSKVDGFHVMVDGAHVGTYETEEDAQAYIDGQLVPQNYNGTILKGTSE